MHGSRSNPSAPRPHGSGHWRSRRYPGTTRRSDPALHGVRRARSAAPEFQPPPLSGHLAGPGCRSNAARFQCAESSAASYVDCSKPRRTSSGDAPFAHHRMRERTHPVRSSTSRSRGARSRSRIPRQRGKHTNTMKDTPVRRKSLIVRSRLRPTPASVSGTDRARRDPDGIPAPLHGFCAHT